LGYLLEHYGLANDEQLQPLRKKLTATYQRLDPVLPDEGHFLARWRLRLNVPGRTRCGEVWLMIPQRDLSRIANSLVTAGRRRIPDAVIERDYVLAWFLVGLAGHELRNTLAFKGGTALRRCWFTGYRFSEDLDFTLTRPMSLGEIRAELDGVFAAVEMASGIRMAFDREDRHNHQNSYTFYLSYQGPLPSANDVKVDITISEALAFPLQDRQFSARTRNSATFRMGLQCERMPWKRSLLRN